MIDVMSRRPERDLPPGRHERLRAELLARLDAEPASPRRFLMPLLAAAAVVAVIAGLAVGLPALRSGPEQVAGGTGGGLASLRIPYVTVEGEQTVLHDGATTVRLNTPGAVLGRAPGGWLQLDWDMPRGKARVGIVNAAGAFLQRGPVDVDTPVLSPDRTQVAVMVRVSGETFRIAVIDLGAGKELASLSLAKHQYLAGWNSSGIWYRTESPGTVQVWEPGRAPQRLQFPGLEGVQVYQTTDRMLLTTRSGDRWCLIVAMRDHGVAPAGRLAPLRQLCGTGASPDGLLSPDGKVLLVTTLKKAVSVESGAQVSLPAMGATRGLESVFEDAEHVLSVTTLRDAPIPSETEEKPLDQRLTRCAVTTGVCETVYERPGSPGGPTIGLVSP